MPRFRYAALFFALASALQAQTAGISGDWREPGGSILRVFPCGAQVCMRVMTLRPHTMHFDIHDPDPEKRTQPLCGFQIGSDFKPQGLDSAVDGRVYDPESGKTYRSEMHTEGDVLHLRGYILLPLLGRSESWKRVSPLAEACHDR